MRLNLLTEMSNEIFDNRDEDKEDTQEFLRFFELDVIRDKEKFKEVYTYENISSIFKQLLDTRENYTDAVEDYLDLIVRIEAWIKDFKEARKSFVYNPRFAQSNAQNLRPFARALYAWRTAARRYRREVNVARTSVYANGQ